MRCPQCSKFVAYDTEVEPEEEDTQIDETNFTATYRRVLTCEECGEELKEASIELAYDFTDEIVEPDGVKDCEVCDGKGSTIPPANPPTHNLPVTCDACDGTGKVYPGQDAGHTHTFEVDNCDADATTESQATDRNGKPIKLARYRKTLYGVHLAVEIKCECGAHANFEVSDNVAASSMDELTCARPLPPKREKHLSDLLYPRGETP